MEPNYITKEGLEKIKKELDYIKKELRPQIIKSLKYAVDLGDLRENAEFDAANDEIIAIDEKICRYEAILDNYKIIKKVDTKKVNICSHVKLQFIDTNEIEEYEIVGEQEADPFKNKISCSSPIALAILGRKVGNIVKVESPNNLYKVKILKIY